MVTSDGGEFTVAVKAVLAKLVAKLPSQVDLGYCPTMEVSQQQFILDNMGEIPFDFEWSLENAKTMPFKIQPTRGHLEVNQSIPITVSFTPTEARYVKIKKFNINNIVFSILTQYVKFQDRKTK